jgi:hypothetical protein
VLRVASLALAGVIALAGCATTPPEQAAREELMWDAARECKSRFATIQSIDRIDRFGQLWFTHLGSGAENQPFLDCYHESIEKKGPSRPLLARGRVVRPSGDLTGTTVPIEVRGRMLLVDARLNGAEPARLILDTGSSHTILTPAMLQRLGLTVPINTIRWPMTVVGGKEVHVPFVRLRSLALGNFSIEEIDVGVFDALPGATGLDGLLGATVLDHFAFTVDRRASTLTLETRR